MKNTSDTRPKSPASESNPILIQAYFDGELKSDELEALSLEAIKSHPMLEALSELREVARYDSQQALEGIDDIGLLNAIHRQIASEKQVTELPKAQRTKSTVGSHIGARMKKSRHWTPVFVGVALLLLSLPGLIMFFTRDKADQIDGQHAIACDATDNNARAKSLMGSQSATAGSNIHNDTAKSDHGQTPETLEVVAPRLQMHQQDEQQLTVQEMDFAIRHLINRIENLEDANRHPYDKGTQDFVKPSYDPLKNGHNL